MADNIQTTTPDDTDFAAVFAALSKDEPIPSQETLADGQKIEQTASQESGEKTEQTASQESGQEDATQTKQDSAGSAGNEGSADNADPGSSMDASGEKSAAKETEPSESDDDVLRRLADLVKNQPQQREEPRQAEPQAQQQAQPEPEPFTAEEKKFLEEYEKDWPDVAKAEALRRRAEYQQLVGYVFNEVAKVLKPQIETIQAISEQTHLQQLQAQVSDYDDIRDKVIDWAMKQPPYLQSAYKHVIEQGTVDEVSDLIARYRQETGSTPSTPQVKTSSKRVETELPPATKQAAAALAPVSSKRSAVIAGEDPNDFESAFSSFASKL